MRASMLCLAPHTYMRSIPYHTTYETEAAIFQDHLIVALSSGRLLLGLGWSGLDSCKLTS